MSSHSRLLPVPDAALGALGYLADAVTGVTGGRRRWRTMPWMVIARAPERVALGLLILPPGPRTQQFGGGWRAVLNPPADPGLRRAR